MRKFRAEEDIDALIDLARRYCEVRAAFEYAKAAGQLSADDEELSNRRLERLNRKIDLLKGNNELDHRRARTEATIIPFPRLKRKLAR